MHSLSTLKDFRITIIDLLKSKEGQYSGSLEEYLRSLWRVINISLKSLVSPELILSLLQQAFETEPFEFDNKWLEYKKPLNWNFRNGEYVIEG